MKKYKLYSMIVAVAVLFAVSEVRGELATPVIPQRTCTAGTLATIVAGPCLPGMTACNGTLAQDFPLTVDCPNQCGGAVDPATGLALSGKFLRWDFLFTPGQKTSPSLVGIEVAADIEIEASIGGAVGSTSSINSITAVGVRDSALNVGEHDWDSHWLRFSGNSSSTSPYLASYFTQQDVKAAQEGVIVKSGSAVASCGLAGAGTTSLAPNQAVPYQQSFNLPGCTVSYNVAADGRVVPGSMQILDGQANCIVNESTTPMTIDGIPTVFVGAAQFTQPGSCSYCFTNTYGAKSCCTCTTCCINNATGRCVQKSTLSSPSTQCRTGTF